MREEQMVRRDRMRYIKNTASSRLAILAIVMNVLFFVSIYKVNVDAYYTWLIGVSILYNLIFMLAAFLASEGVKKYNIRYSLLMVILGIGQVVRIFIIPGMMRVMEYTETVTKPIISRRTGKQIGLESELILKIVMGQDQYTRVVIYLCVSALCLLAAAGINWYKHRELEKAQTADFSLQQT